MKIYRHKPVVLSGLVSHLSTIATTFSPARDTVATEHETRFRVGGGPAFFSGVASIVDGDSVTVVGYQQGDALQVFAMRNDTTGMEYLPTAPKRWLGWVLIAFGIPLTLFFGLGLFFVGVGLLVVFGSNKNNEEMIAILRRARP
jgi:hypothetical protein